MADQLIQMRIFVQVIEAGSLSAAARELGLSPAVVSRRLAALEKRLGVRLINRTTRSLSLTDEGADFQARCLRILAEIEEAETQAAIGARATSGELRVTTSVAFARRLAPLLHDFQQTHEGLSVRLHASDAVVNIVEGGFDLAVRFGTLADSSLIAREVAPNRRVICAAPAYLARHGRPSHPDELVHHDCVLMGDPPLATWQFADGTSVHVNGRFTSNDGEIAHLWALQGAGLVLKSIWDVQEDLASGRLKTVLDAHPLPCAAIHAMYPHRRFVAPKVRLCVDYLRERLAEQAAALPEMTAIPA
ncbi:transcriptional regulator, LysR family protein [Salinisphaera dokdonensis CL-ES53]|uniref:Transcriptional regulator, LysR family protein n=1 Tax=Salinisphaera dokdonensis CL-ES53 TaxID=1304272 RepID=A0ABV2AWI0_9GAMM